MCETSLLVSPTFSYYRDVIQLLDGSPQRDNGGMCFDVVLMIASHIYYSLC